MKTCNLNKYVRRCRVRCYLAKITVFAGVLFACHVSYGQHVEPDVYKLEEVVVKGNRTLAEIGMQKTVLDTVLLRDNVTSSLADILSVSSPIFIKSYGRATLSTASFRGTAPSHTQVSWNGMKLNSPMLGMVDFSMIPSYFIDDASLYHGASSVGVTGGGLGGAVALSTEPARQKGLGARFIQGISSFDTFDEFLRVTYGNDRVQTSTRVYYASSDNDFKYRNIYKKEFVYDENGDITGYKRPVERNRNGSFKDLHVLQEVYYLGKKGSRWGLSAWYLDSRRGVPMLNVSYRDEDDSRNRQDEQTFRSVLSWDKFYVKSRLSAKGGYTYTDMRYLYQNALGNGKFADGVRSVSYMNTAFGHFEAEFYPHDKWSVTTNADVHQYFVDSKDKAIVTGGGNTEPTGYKEARLEASVFASARYKPGERWGFAINLREELYGDKLTPLIPALFAEYVISKRGNVVAKASAARNYRYPSLNDLYFMPGGNDTLRSEKGFTYDAGIEFRTEGEKIRFGGEATFFDSYIDDWIAWLPTYKGFWSPVNVKKVHSYGMEVRADMTAELGRRWTLALTGNFNITNAINEGDPVNWADEAIGKQLVYIPKYSSAVIGRLKWKSWEFVYKWNYYSERFTTSSNETATSIGRINPYYMNDVSLAKSFRAKWADFSLKFTVNNLFGEAYESVLSRPMPGRNFGFFLEISPRF